TTFARDWSSDVCSSDLHARDLRVRSPRPGVENSGVVAPGGGGGRGGTDRLAGARGARGRRRVVAQGPGGRLWPCGTGAHPGRQRSEERRVGIGGRAGGG